VFGLTKSDWDILNSICFQPLKKAGTFVWVYGSRARGDHQKFSDIDILYQNAPADLVRKIKDQLEESRLSIKVDLVDESHLAESYKASVIKDRVAVD
jgi:predicted nucleotidyltransferase